MDIYLIRHGETDWNRMKKLQGTTDIPLNAYGIELAEKTAEGLKDIPFDAAILPILSISSSGILMVRLDDFSG